MPRCIMALGIEAIGVAVPPACVRLDALAKARGVEPSKYLEGLGTHVMGVALPDEDTVTLAARAARMALESSGASTDSIGMLVVGTETAVDHSKPVASFVQGLLGIGQSCRVFETKHACYGGTAALQLSLDWIASGSARGKKALIICSDIARYGIKTAGEPTQGAGAVALLISDTPSLVELQPGQSGICAIDVHDFWRPLYSKDAFVDGHYSVQCYLDALTGAYRGFQQLTGLNSESFAALAYHVPYGKMAKKAHRQVRTLDGKNDGDQTFDALVSPGLELPALVGNIYTGSLYLSLTSLLNSQKLELSGKKVGLFSYGSGSCAEFFAGTVMPGAQEKVRALKLDQLLQARTVLDIPEYERVMEARLDIDERPATRDPVGEFSYLGVSEHRRTYARPARA